MSDGPIRQQQQRTMMIAMNWREISAWIKICVR